MGNRGILHDENQNLQTPKWQHQAWVTCVLEHRDKKGFLWHREIMSPRRYTELFFLDEATALSAGHRPCGLCRNKAYRAFTPALGNRFSSVKELDRTLHQERTHQILGKIKPQQTYGPELPDGVMVTIPASPGVAFLKKGHALYPWSHHGYGLPVRLPSAHLQVLTPALIVEAINNGYPVCMHTGSIQSAT